MSEKIENPPAFPTQLLDTVAGRQMAPHLGGMTLRDWFAGMALQGMRAHIDGYNLDAKEAASYAYTTADALLAQRQKEETK